MKALIPVLIAGLIAGGCQRPQEPPDATTQVEAQASPFDAAQRASWREQVLAGKAAAMPVAALERGEPAALILHGRHLFDQGEPAMATEHFHLAAEALAADDELHRLAARDLKKAQDWADYLTDLNSPRPRR